MNQTLRVLHVVVDMNRRGSETLIMNIYRNINRDRVQFDFLTSGEGVYDQEILSLGGRIHKLPYKADANPRKYAKEMEAFLKSGEPYSIIHSHIGKMSGLVLKTAKNSGVPIRIAHGHKSDFNGSFKSDLLGRYYGRNITYYANQLLACSESSAAWLFKESRSKAAIIKNGVNLEEFNYSLAERFEMREILGIRKTDFVIGHVGRFCKMKNQDFALKIFVEVLKRKPSSILLFVGEGETRQEIESRAEELGVSDKTIFLGVREDVNKIYQTLDVLLYPSKDECLGNVLLEAQACGIPCVVSATISDEVIVCRDLINKLSLSDNTEKWINTISSINQTRHSRSKALKRAGYDVKDIAKELEEKYMDMLETYELSELLPKTSEAG